MFTPEHPDWTSTPSPNRFVGRPLPVTGIIIHYTAAGSAKSSADYFSRSTVKVKDAHGNTVTKKVGASAHVVIERDGSVIQCVPFSDRAWHAGVCTKYMGRPLQPGLNVNDVTVGIELANYGKLTVSKDKDGKEVLLNYLGKPFTGLSAKAPDGTVWEAYTEAQIAAAITVARVAMKKYPTISLAGVEGHNDIAPTRKVDPGPLWDMEAFKKALGSLDEVKVPTVTLKSTAYSSVTEIALASEDRSGRHYDDEAKMCLVDEKKT
jgi:N-acetylmuramoyl-L-alanine amidase